MKVNKHNKNKLKRTLITLLSLLVLLTLGFSIYVSDYYAADETALNMLQSSETVTVEFFDNGVAFLPENAETGFIFYPGGKVEYTAYAPLLHQLAAENIACILLEMPFHLAVLDINAGAEIPASYPQIANWYIGGHSLGGSMAASHTAHSMDLYEGLILLASYSTADFSGTDMNVLSVYGSEDQVLNAEKYAEYYVNLPDSTQEMIIQGGCHAYFGSYGPQQGDGTPTITSADQLELTIQYIADFILQ